MNTPKIALTYCIDNIKIAEEIERRLSLSSPYRFEHIYCKKNTADAALTDQLRTFRGPILLLISDNFLKSAQCMNRSLSLLQTQGSQILPIVIDGVAREDETGREIPVPTNFERVSDIIQYINYWQDQYLDLRRQKRQLKGLDEEKFNAHLKVMREISSEAGEFLRLLRNTDYVLFRDFSGNHFRRFFEFVEDLPSWEQFRVADMTRPHTPAEKEGEEAKASIDLPVTFEKMPAEENQAKIEEEQLQVEEEETVEGEANTGHSDILTEPEEEHAVSSNALLTEDEEEEEEEDEEDEDEEEDYEEEDEDEDEEEEDEEDLEDILEQAAAYAGAGQWDRALNVLAAAVEQRPTDTYLRYRYALALAQRQDNIPAAIEQLQTILELDSTNVSALFLQGELAELSGDFQRARQCYLDVANIAPDHPDIFYRLGIVVANHFPEDAEQATRYFEQAFAQNPNHVDAHYQYAMLMSESLQLIEPAIEHFLLVLEKQPDHPFANYDLALLYHRLGDTEQAGHFYRLAIELNPELQTEENDLAFQLHPQENDIPAEEQEEELPLDLVAELTGETQAEAAAPAGEPEPPTADAPAEKPSEDDPLEALKRNIKRLEEMLKAREGAVVAEPPKKTGQGRIVMITGATSGIGRATAKEFAENGYRLILTGRRQERLDRLREVFEEVYQAEVKTLCFDVRDPKEIERVFQDELDFEWRQIDILINNAGKAKGFDPIHRGRLDHWEEMIDTNVKGLLYMTRAVAQHMVKRRNGHIINIASTAGKEVYPMGNVYCATKFAVDALTKAIRMDLLKYNIRVSQVSPGHVEQTEFAEVRFDGDTDKAQIYSDFVPLNARDVAETIFFIATRPRHVDILDVVLSGTQQAGSTQVDRRGREMLDFYIDRIEG